MQKKIEKKFFVFGFCVLGFYVPLKETFSNASTFTVLNKYFKGSAIQITTVFGPICLVVYLRVLSNRAF